MADGIWRGLLRRVTGAKPKQGQGQARNQVQDQAQDQAHEDAELVRQSALFDAGWYLAKYPDVAAAQVDPALHYATHGGTGSEGRDPGPGFSTLEYLRLYPDVANAGVNALVHYERHGRKEGRLLPAAPPSGRAAFVPPHAASPRAAPPPRAARSPEADLRQPPAARVLVVDDRVPIPSLGSGLPRARELLRGLCAAGVRVTHYPTLGEPIPLDEVRAAVPPEVEFADPSGGLAAFLGGRVGCYDLVIVSRPHNMALFRQACDLVPAFPATTTVVYDAEAVFALREAGRAGLVGQPDADLDGRSALATELRLAEGARIVLAVSEAEAAHFRAAGCRDVRVLGHSLSTAPAAAGFAVRSGFLFVGRLEESESPNADSIRWFVREIMPLLDRLIGADYGFDVVGGSAAELRGELESSRVRFHGRVADVGPFYAGARAFVAPTRYAAGIPHKVHEAAAAGLPVVATRLLAGQLGWTDQAELLEAATADAFARACSRLYREPALWAGVRERALARVGRDCDPRVFSAVLRGVLDDVLGNVPGERAAAPAGTPDAFR